MVSINIRSRKPLLGKFDIAVIEGGIVGFVCAHMLSLQGYKVVIIEPRGQLLWEITRARQCHFDITLMSGLSPFMDTFLEELEHKHAIFQNHLDPVEACFAADKVTRQQPNLSVLFNSRVISSECFNGNSILSVCTKGSLDTVVVDAVMDCSDQGQLLRKYGHPMKTGNSKIYWKLLVTDTNKKLAPILADHQMEHAEINLLPTQWENETAIEVVYDKHPGSGNDEMNFSADISRLFAEIKEASPSQQFELLHVADEPWIIPDYYWELEPGYSGTQQDHAFILSPTDKLKGTGLWVEGMQSMLSPIKSNKELNQLAMLNLFKLGADLSASI